MVSFDPEGTYKCVCGKEFQTANSFNGHKSHCKEHQTQKHGSLEFYNQIRQDNSIKQSNTQKITADLKKQKKLYLWIAEQHQCECCGKVMTEKYGSGRFCCKACANTRKHSEETKNKIRESLELKYENSEDLIIKYQYLGAQLKERSIQKYNKNPKLCKFCGEAISYEKRRGKFCCDSCKSKQYAFDINLRRQLNGPFHVTSRYKWGTYRGIRCDSSWELAFLVYLEEQTTITVTRNTEWFPYIYKNLEHLYSPDFIVNDTYLEIKNYHTEQVQTKIDYFPSDKKLILLYKKDIQCCINYCKVKYGRKFWQVLYDKDKPSCNDIRQ